MIYRAYEDYLAMLADKPAGKIALADDARSYTYGELCELAGELRRKLEHAAGNEGRRALFIREEGIAEQLLHFLAYSGTSCVPVIATRASREQHFLAGNIPIPERACMGVMTSGSTGKSKLLWRDQRSWADFFPEQNRVFGVDENTVIFCQGSLAFTGNLNIYLGVLAAGGTLAVTEKFRPRHWVERMERCGANSIYLIPSKLMLLTKCASAPDMRVRSIISGSQSMGRGEAERIRRAFPQAELTLYYGASELNYISYIRGGEMTEDRTLIGRPFRDVSISIENEEIFIDTPYHVLGISVPFSLKDRGYLDAEGRLHFLGRTDDILNVNGRKVSAAKVAAALKDLPGITEAAVMARHAGDADMLLAFVEGEREYAKQELLKFLRPALAEHELPKKFIFLKRFPLNESGKIDRQALARWQL